MTDTGRGPGEGQPESMGGQRRQSGPPSLGAYSFGAPTGEVVGEDDPMGGGVAADEDDMLLMPGSASAWSDPVAAAPPPRGSSGPQPMGSSHPSLTVPMDQVGSSGPRRPLHLGPPEPESSGAVRSLAERGPRAPQPTIPGPGEAPAAARPTPPVDAGGPPAPPEAGPGSHVATEPTAPTPPTPPPDGPGAPVPDTASDLPGVEPERPAPRAADGAVVEAPPSGEAPEASGLAPVEAPDPVTVLPPAGPAPESPSAGVPEPLPAEHPDAAPTAGPDHGAATMVGGGLPWAPATAPDAVAEPTTAGEPLPVAASETTADEVRPVPEATPDQPPPSLDPFSETAVAAPDAADRRPIVLPAPRTAPAAVSREPTPPRETVSPPEAMPAEAMPAEAAVVVAPPDPEGPPEGSAARPEDEAQLSAPVEGAPIDAVPVGHSGSVTVSEATEHTDQTTEAAPVESGPISPMTTSPATVEATAPQPEPQSPTLETSDGQPVVTAPSVDRPPQSDGPPPEGPAGHTASTAPAGAPSPTSDVGGPAGAPDGPESVADDTASVAATPGPEETPPPVTAPLAVAPAPGAAGDHPGDAPPTTPPVVADRPTEPAASGYAENEREALHRVMRDRRDIRQGFRLDPIPHEVLLRVLEAAHTAPSVGHSQPWDFVVIRSAETRQVMHELATRQREVYASSLPKGRAKQFKELKTEAILDTPVNIVVTADPTRGGRHTLGRHTQPQMAPYSSVLAVENLWLAARAEGLGVGWVSFFDEREMVRALGLPEHLEVVAYLCVGYVDAFPDEPELVQAGWSKRRPLSWVVHEESYGRRVLPGAEPHDLLAETLTGIRPLDAKALGEAWERQKRMTKPSGALGMLEIISAQLSGLSRKCPPPIPEPAAVAIFAGDHGVHAQGVTAWPQEVTAQMVANFLDGGAVCNAFSHQVGAEVCVIDVGVAGELSAAPGLLPRKVRPGTADFSTGPAMTRQEVLRAVDVGIETARDLVTAGNKALLTGEMGIANTTVAAALISVFTGADPAEVTGRGTGVSDEMHARKIEVVRRGLELHQPDAADPIGVLAAIGGLEHAALVGLILGGASLRTPVVLDGVSAGASALVARALAPEALAACIAGHRSAEPGHVAALTKLGLRPLVDLDLRLGEGTGALLALPVIQSAARAMHEVATFDSAGVTEKN